MNKEEITRRTEDNDEEIMKEKTNNEEIKVELGLSSVYTSSPIISLIIGLKKPLLSWDCPSLGRNEIKPVEDKTTPRSIIGGRVEDKHSRWNG